MVRKDDADEIGLIVDQLGEAMLQSAPTDPRRHWPHFLFHITDVQNAASILSAREILSRTRAIRSKSLVTDTKSPDIIRFTSGNVLNSVRLYFRPRTPTFFHSEGIRPLGQRAALGSHCPVPVAFVLDAKTILGESGVTFSDGNASSPRARFGADAEFFRSLPFSAIYHDGPILSQADRRELRFRRCAEVLVPNPLHVDGPLRGVFVRSVAEAETLRSVYEEISGLPALARGVVKVNSPQTPLFYRSWTYVEEVFFDQRHFIVRFSPDSETPGPFTVTLEIRANDTGKVFHAAVMNHVTAVDPVEFALPNLAEGRPYRFTLQLDDCLAYQNVFISPFNLVIVPPAR